MNSQNHARKEIDGMFDGPVVPLTLRIALPMLASQILQLFYSIVDTFFISRIDPSSTALLSGTGLMFPVFFFFMAMGASISVGTSSLVGRVIGARDTRAAGHIMASSLTMVLCIALPLLIFGYGFSGALVRALAGNRLSEEAISYGLRYFRWLVPGLAVLLVMHGVGGILQGEGLTGKLARAMMLSTGANIVLDPLFIFVFGMGVSGAALATSISVCISAGYVLAVFLKGHTATPFVVDLTKARWTVMREIVRIGFPHFLSMASMSISFMVFNKVVGSIGQTAMNAWTLAGRMDQIALIPSFAVGAASIPIIAQNYGRGNLERVRGAYRKNIGLAMAMVGIGAIVYNIVAVWLFPLFTSVPEVIAAAVRQVRVLSFTFLGVSVAIVSSSTFQATGRPLPALLLTIVRVAGIAIPAVLIMVYVFDLGIAGVWAGLAAGNIAIAPLAFYAASRHLSRLRPRAVLQ